MVSYLVELFQVVSDGGATLYGFHCLMKLLPGVLSVVIRQFRSVCKSRSESVVNEIRANNHTSFTQRPTKKYFNRHADKEHRNYIIPIQSTAFVNLLHYRLCDHHVFAKYILC